MTLKSRSMWPQLLKLYIFLKRYCHIGISSTSVMKIQNTSFFNTFQSDWGDLENRQRSPIYANVTKPLAWCISTIYFVTRVICFLTLLTSWCHYQLCINLKRMINYLGELKMCLSYQRIIMLINETFSAFCDTVIVFVSFSWGTRVGMWWIRTWFRLLCVSWIINRSPWKEFYWSPGWLWGNGWTSGHSQECGGSGRAGCIYK